MKKLLLIDLGDLRGELNEPLGIECISSRVIRKGNIKVDMQWYSMTNSIPYDDLKQYDFIGLSMNIGTLSRFEEIHDFLAKSKKKCGPLILGGCIPTFAYEQLIDRYEDIVCIYGEGEEPFFQLIQNYINDTFCIDERLLSISNLAFKLNGATRITGKKPLDLMAEGITVRNVFILDYIKRNHGIVRLEGSRGCSWNKCSFCCVSAKYADPSWRGFSIEKITNELIELSNMGFHAPYFTDEDFFGQKYDRAIELGNTIIALKKQGKIREDMNFFISILAADAVCEAGKKALAVLKEAGLREVFLGIESLEKEQLLRYGKKANVDINTKAMRYIEEIGLSIDSGYILFDPEMSFEALGINIEYIGSLRLNQFDSRSLKRLRIQPLTQICTTLSGVITDGLDVDNLEYPYRFRDERVSKVYYEYQQWEKADLTDSWKIQSASRGEVDEEFRYKLKSLLGQIRDLDFDVLKKIYESIENNEEIVQEAVFAQQKEQKGRIIQEAFMLIHEYQ